MGKHRARFTIEIDVDIMCDWNNPEERSWAFKQMKDASGIFISGEVGDLLDDNAVVTELKVFNTEGLFWKEVKDE